jgi:hypothetical protein
MPYRRDSLKTPRLVCPSGATKLAHAYQFLECQLQDIMRKAVDYFTTFQRSQPAAQERTMIKLGSTLICAAVVDHPPLPSAHSHADDMVLVELRAVRVCVVESRATDTAELVAVFIRTIEIHGED